MYSIRTFLNTNVVSFWGIIKEINKTKQNKVTIITRIITRIIIIIVIG